MLQGYDIQKLEAYYKVGAVSILPFGNNEFLDERLGQLRSDSGVTIQPC